MAATYCHETLWAEIKGIEYEKHQALGIRKSRTMPNWQSTKLHKSTQSKLCAWEARKADGTTYKSNIPNDPVREPA